VSSIQQSPKLCECGCGEPTNPALYTSARHGWIKGQPVRFKRGHRARSQYASPEQRFWSQVDTSAGPDACWPWIGYIGIRGYGQIQVNGQPMPAHRYSLELAVGPLGPDKFACHACDNKSCCNPAHLFAGTPSENTQDMINKGRGIGGERHPLHKLTLEQIAEIRALYAAGGAPQHVIAAQYGVSQAIISKIVRHEVWRHPS
jgi:hypothetical protein